MNSEYPSPRFTIKKKSRLIPWRIPTGLLLQQRIHLHAKPLIRLLWK